jgi:hypothetical protein
VNELRRSESLSKVAASVTAIGAEQLGAGGIKDIGSLANAVPNLSVGDQFGVNRTFIRGIGLTSIDLGADGAVAFLQDGAILARPAAQLSGFYDVERVEVLRRHAAELSAEAPHEEQRPNRRMRVEPRRAAERRERTTPDGDIWLYRLNLVVAGAE